MRSRVIFLPPYNDAEALREIEGFSHLWLLFDFSKTRKQGWSATVRPPRLGGNKRVGVFASRSPFRPNHIGLSCVKLEQIVDGEHGKELLVSGAELLDGTPIFDIKPYLPFADCIADAKGGYAQAQEAHRLEVRFDGELAKKLPEDKLQGLCECLADDPRPSYQEDGKAYGMRFAEFEITVKEGVLTVFEVEKALDA